MTRAAPLLLAALFISLRLVQLDADPPRRYPSGESAHELLAEGPAKANEARRYGIFGTFETKPANEYRIWSIQSPTYVLILSRFFRVVGTSRAALRVFCALAGVLGLLAIYAIGRRHSHALVAPLACAICALSFFDIQLTRGALIEPYLNALLSASFLCSLLALEQLPWLLLAELSFALALLAKQTAVFAAPALLACGVFAHLRAKKRAVPAYQHALTIGLGLALATALLAYIRSDAYWQTVEWNVGHMLVGVEEQRAISTSVISIQEVLGRMVDAERWQQILLYIVPLAPFALLQIARTVRGFVRTRAIEPVDWLACAWLLSALLVLQLTMHVRPRFSIIVLPPAALLAASFIAFATERMRAGWPRYAPIALAGLLVLLTDVRWQASALLDAHHDLRRTTKLLARKLDKRAVVIGSSAPFLAFDTKADLFYVRAPFNTGRKTLKRLGVTHLLLRNGDHTGNSFEKLFSAQFGAKRELLRFRALGTAYTLYRVPR